MILPYTFKLRHTQYTVTQLDAKSKHTGNTYPLSGAIDVATRHYGHKRSDAAIELTFWHEATHAILHDMGSVLWDDEKFVTQFSERLVKLINTARFK